MSNAQLPAVDNAELPQLNRFEDEINRALDELAITVQVNGPHVVPNHTNYIISGLLEAPEHIENLCWILLGFVGDTFTTDFLIDNAIGSGDQAANNLIELMQNTFGYLEELSERQKESNRDPLLQELIAHALVLIHQRQQKIPEWLGDVIACRPPHLNANEPGLDLIAIGSEDGSIYPVVGEMKAYETDPSGGFITACSKFTEVRNGDHNGELRRALRDMGLHHGITRQQLADNVWTTESKFGAVIGHDNRDEIVLPHNYSSTAQAVIEQQSDKLFLICTPFESMRELFDDLVEKMAELAKWVRGE